MGKLKNLAEDIRDGVGYLGALVTHDKVNQLKYAKSREDVTNTRLQEKRNNLAEENLDMKKTESFGRELGKASLVLSERRYFKASDRVDRLENELAAKN